MGYRYLAIKGIMIQAVVRLRVCEQCVCVYSKISALAYIINTGTGTLTTLTLMFL